MLGLRSDGGYAELVSVPRREPHCRFLRTSISSTAAAFPLTFLTAWHMLITRAGLRDGDVVLVLAGGSGVGQAAIQLGAAFRRARLRDGRAGQSGSDPRARRRAGFDHYAGDFREGTAGRVDSAGRGADIVIEHVGGGDLGWDRQRPRAARPAAAPRDVRRDDRPRGRDRSASPVRAAAVAARILHGPLRRARDGRAAALRRHQVDAGHRRGASARARPPTRSGGSKRRANSERSCLGGLIERLGTLRLAFRQSGR